MVSRGTSLARSFLILSLKFLHSSDDTMIWQVVMESSRVKLTICFPPQSLLISHLTTSLYLSPA